jgi:hypothetical protein
VYTTNRIQRDTAAAPEVVGSRRAWFHGLVTRSSAVVVGMALSACLALTGGACGNKSASDPTYAGYGGNKSATDPTCAGYDDEPSPGTTTFKVVNQRAETIFLNLEFNCNAPFVVQSAGKDERPFFTKLQTSCSDAKMGHIPCCDCSAIPSTAIVPGGSSTIAWNGLFVRSTMMPKACVGSAPVEPQFNVELYQGSCDRGFAAPAGKMTVRVRYETGWCGPTLAASSAGGGCVQNTEYFTAQADFVRGTDAVVVIPLK